MASNSDPTAVATATALNLVTQTLAALNAKNILSAQEIQAIAQKTLDGSAPSDKAATKAYLKILLPSIDLR